MRVTELLRLAWLNINQNRFKTIMTSIGIVVGAATIVMVIGIGRGGQMDIAEQFAELNAGAIDISYDYAGSEGSGKNAGAFGNMGRFFENMQGGMPAGRMNQEFSGEKAEGFSGENAGKPESPPSDEEIGEEESETSMVEDRLNQEQIILSQEDVDDIETYISGISGVTISYRTRASVEGGALTSAQTYTVAGVKESFETVAKLELGEGYFITDSDEEAKSRVCVLGSETAEELFEDVSEALNSTIYISDRSYTVIGVLESGSAVTSGISQDSTIFVPYQTGIKYLTGESIDPVITVIAEDVNTLSSVIANTKTVLERNYPNASFNFEDSGSKMEAAEASNNTLTLILSAMAAIVFLVGGIGIMNVLFVSVKERTGEIGILKAIGTPRSAILAEFLIEAAAVSLIGGILGVAVSFGVTPVVRHFEIRVEVNLIACLAALAFAVLTGTIFGIYPAWKASRLEPVEALTSE